MVHDVEITAGGAAHGVVGRIERARTGKGTQDAVRAQVGEQGLADVQQAQDVFCCGGIVVRTVRRRRRGAQDGDGTVRDEDVSVGAFVQAVDHTRRETVVEDDQRPAVGRHTDVQAGQMGDLPRPGTGGIDHVFTGDVQFLTSDAVAGRDTRDLAVALLDGDDFVIGEDVTAVAPGTQGIVPDQAETVDAGVRHAVNRADIGGKVGLQPPGFGHVDALGDDARTGTGFDPAWLEGRVVQLGADEKAFGLLHALFADAAQDHVFFDAFPGGFAVTDSVPGAAVQQAVETGARAVGQAPLFQQQGGHAAHAQVAQNADTCRTTANDDHCGFFHTVLRSQERQL